MCHTYHTQGLTLSRNKIGDPGGTAIADALKVNTTLQEPNLYGVPNLSSALLLPPCVVVCRVVRRVILSRPCVLRSSSCVASVPGARLLRR